MSTFFRNWDLVEALAPKSALQTLSWNPFATNTHGFWRYHHNGIWPRLAISTLFATAGKSRMIHMDFRR